MDFNADHKKEYQRSFPFGVNKVQILNFVLDSVNDKEYIEVFFVSEDGEVEDSARVWFTTDKSIQYSFNTLKNILVHNAPEDKKDKAREAIDNVKNTAELVELLKSKLIGKEMWMTKYLDPVRTFTGQDGREYKSTNKNIYGYEPKLQPELMPQQNKQEPERDDVGMVKEVFPGAKSVDEAMDTWS